MYTIHRTHLRLAAVVAATACLWGLGCTGTGDTGLEVASRPFAVDPATDQQRVLGIFDSELGVQKIGLYINSGYGQIVISLAELLEKLG